MPDLHTRALAAAATEMRLAEGEDPARHLAEDGTPRRGECLYRSFLIGGPDTAGRAAIDEDARTVELAFSSEEPYQRFFGTEILDHGRAAVRMGRLMNGAALLNQHNTREQIGVVERASIDADRRGRATVRFGRGPLAEEIWQDVRDGIRRHVSVGYRVHDMVLAEQGDEGDTYRVTDWEPLEISIVSVPADASVGVGRAHDTGRDRGNIHQQEITTMPEQTRDDVLDDERNTQARAAEDTGRAAEDHDDGDTATTQAPDTAARESEDAAIRKLGRQFGEEAMAEDYVELRGSADDLRAAILAKRRATKPQPVPAARDVHIEMRSKRFKPLRGFAREEDAYRAGAWVMASLYGNERAARWCRDHYVRAASTSVISKGGAVVPEELSQAIIDLRDEYGVARRLCRVVPMNSDTLTVPRRTGGVTAYAVGQSDTITASDKEWDQVSLVARKWAALSKMPSEYVEDAFIDVAGDIADEMAYAFAVKEDEAYINGDGTSTYHGIIGLRTKLIDGSHTAGAIDAASGVDQFSEVTNTDLTTLLGKVPQYARRNLRLLCSSTARSVTFDRLGAAAGGTTMTELAGRMMSSYLGRPIEESEAMPSATTALNNVVMILAGDFARASTMGDRRGFVLKVLQERYADTDEIGVQATTRFDIVNHDLGDTSTPGPVVGLVGNT